MWTESVISTLLGKLGDKLFNRLIKTKLTIEVTCFSYSLINNEPGSSVAFMTPYPSRYDVELSLSNIGGKTTTIKQINAIINKELKLDCANFKPIRLEPGDFYNYNLIFPVKEQKAIREGTFEIEVLDVYGKTFKCKGEFPLKEKISY